MIRRLLLSQESSLRR